MENTMTTDKILVYLDQNIFDQMRRQNLGELKQLILEKCIVVYSLTSLEEMDTKSDLRDEYIELLELFDSRFLYIKSMDSDEGVLINRPVRDIINEIRANSISDNGVQKYLENFGNKLVGGQQGTSFSEILDNQLNAMNLAMSSINVSEIEDQEMQKNIVSLIEKNGIMYSAIIKNLKDTIAMTIPNQEDFGGLKESRKQIEIGPKELNNISCPNAIEKIWSICKKNPKINKGDLTIEKFLGIDESLYGKKLSRLNKIVIIYETLNCWGYWPDSNQEKLFRYRSSLKDGRHVAAASFCDYLISADVCMAKKAEVIFEYLNIKTKTQKIEIQ
jgi:hypothetical protein